MTNKAADSINSGQNLFKADIEVEKFFEWVVRAQQFDGFWHSELLWLEANYQLGFINAEGDDEEGEDHATQPLIM